MSEENIEFNFGAGKVPAHRHKNGNGWIANTVFIDDTVYVYCNAQIYGNAQISGDARISGNAWIESPPYFQCGRWGITLSKIDTVAIGCESINLLNDIDSQLLDLAERHNATDYELSTARCILFLMSDINSFMKIK